MSDIFEKIGKLKQIYLRPADQRELDDTERFLRRKAVEAKLSEIDEVGAIVADAHKKIKEIDYILCNDEKLEEAERKVLFNEKKVIQYYVIDRLGGEKAVQQINKTEKEINFKLETK